MKRRQITLEPQGDDTDAFVIVYFLMLEGDGITAWVERPLEMHEAEKLTEFYEAAGFRVTEYETAILLPSASRMAAAFTNMRDAAFHTMQAVAAGQEAHVSAIAREVEQEKQQGEVSEDATELRIAEVEA